MFFHKYYYAREWHNMKVLPFLEYLLLRCKSLNCNWNIQFLILTAMLKRRDYYPYLVGEKTELLWGHIASKGQSQHPNSGLSGHKAISTTAHYLFCGIRSVLWKDNSDNIQHSVGGCLGGEDEWDEGNHWATIAVLGGLGKTIQCQWLSIDSKDLKLE
jgi:hypothetical protein